MKNSVIVLIDDSLPEAMLCKEVFKDLKTDSTLVVFHDPQLALDYIRVNAKSIFFILCDIDMPSMTGMELREKIIAEQDITLEYIPFIFLSNSISQSNISRAYSLMANGYFQKPMNMDGLSQTFTNIITYWTEARTKNGIHANLAN